MKNITLEELNDRYDGIKYVCDELQINLVGVDMDEPVVVEPDGFSNVEFHASLSIEGDIEQLVMRIKHDYEDEYVEMDIDDIEGTIDNFNLLDTTNLSRIMNTLTEVVELENEHGLSILIGYNQDEVWLEFSDGVSEYNVLIDSDSISVEVDGEDEEQEKRDRLEELRREVAELEEELGE